MRGDLQEGHSYASRCQFPVRPSTKLPFLCAFALRNPYFRVFQAQKGLFCVRKGNFSQVLPHPEHKIGVFVLFWPSGPPFSGISSTKLRFLCSGCCNRGDAYLSTASGRAITKRVTSKSPNGLFSYPLLWIGICCRCNWGRNICCCRWNWNICCRCDHCSCGALESINSAKLEIAPIYVINYSVLVLNGETPVIVEHILETGSKIKGKSTLCILSSRRV